MLPVPALVRNGRSSWKMDLPFSRLSFSQNVKDCLVLISSLEKAMRSFELPNKLTCTLEHAASMIDNKVRKGKGKKWEKLGL